MNLIQRLIEEGWLKTERIIKAFKEIKRKDFLPEDKKGLEDLNKALSIGQGQTISQPLVVAFMMEKLQPRPGEKVLDIGSGSGWTTALLAHMVGEKGEVFGVEINNELVKFGQKNVGKYPKLKGRVKIIHGNGRDGLKKQAPFDKILASASAQKIPKEWKKQIKEEGKIVTPIKNSIWEIKKIGENDFSQKEHKGFLFVPLIN